MNEIFVHATGVVATDVSARMVDDVMVASFRMVSTTRRFDRGQGSWVDGDKTWLTVTCWRSLAKNVHKSLLKSERVVVAGRLKVSEWRDQEGRPRSRTEIVADAVGHDLTFGSTVLTRTPRVEPLAQEPRDRIAAELAEQSELAAERVDLDELLTGVPRPTPPADPDPVDSRGETPETPGAFPDDFDPSTDDDEEIEDLDDLVLVETVPLPAEITVPEPANETVPSGPGGGRRRR